MTQDEIMKMHADSGKFGKPELVTFKIAKTSKPNEVLAICWDEFIATKIVFHLSTNRDNHYFYEPVEVSNEK